MEDKPQSGHNNPRFSTMGGPAASPGAPSGGLAWPGMGGTADRAWPRGRCSPTGIALPAQMGAFPTQPLVRPCLGIAWLRCWRRPLGLLMGFGALVPITNETLFVSSQDVPLLLAFALMILPPSRGGVERLTGAGLLPGVTQPGAGPSREGPALGSGTIWAQHPGDLLQLQSSGHCCSWLEGSTLGTHPT